MPALSWRAVILAAGRGADDPMAKAFGVEHKCTIAVGGKPMLARVVAALEGTVIKKPYVVSIDDAAAMQKALGRKSSAVSLQAGSSAPASAKQAIEHIGSYPVLITTGDHALLTPAMVDHLMQEAEHSGADVLAGLATFEVISTAYPETRRTYFNLGGTRVSGCNLFAVMSQKGLRLLDVWQDLEQNRKKPWKLVAAFGLRPLVYFATGRLTPQRAFGLISDKLGMKVAPIFMPFAEAAIDVDKPSDHTLAEKIIAARG